MDLFTRLRGGKRYAVLLVAAAAMFTLAACNGGNPNSGPSPAANVPGVSNDTITIGAVLDTTGPLKVICAPILAGDQLYFDKINAAGGINGRKVKLVQVSDDGNSTKTKGAVRQLFEQNNAFALFQVCGSGNANVASSYTNAKQIPFVDPIGGGSKFNDAQGKALPWVWMTQPNYGDEGHVIGYYLTNKQHAKTVGLLYENDVLGLQQKTTLGESLQKNGAQLSTSVGYNATQTDFTAAVQTMKAAHPDIIVLNGLPGPTAKFIAAATSQGYHPPMGYLANYPMADNSWAKVLGPAGEDTYVSGYTSTAAPIGQEYLKATSADTSFSAYKFYGYINAKIFSDALMKAGKDLTRDSLRNALDHDFSNYDTGFGPSLTWTPDKHGGVSDFMFLQIKKAQLTQVSDFIKAAQVWP
ncbi:branched-chain amino acid ABC transporter substrate-binding protein [Dictyobacter alpinus]|uniref:Branched-chain amino acid ABC transporter substrate-binding protein n=1 Tax=Dictyobacter alpinus TaxID=2014873 RepID=A0A402BKA2_9CHLR|nr:ABC transporter substrate-binding protein [Dictyobacter alpinus]GCE31756.1 branched-chain amino acid ABC transporter substrate-binding protein [Dictyobacter alpinus]